jgi:hypothetical protein
MFSYESLSSSFLAKILPRKREKRTKINYYKVVEEPALSFFSNAIFVVLFFSTIGIREDPFLAIWHALALGLFDPGFPVGTSSHTLLQPVGDYYYNAI